MAEQDPTRVQTGSAVLDIGEDVGALIIYTRPELHAREIEVSPKGFEYYRVHTAVLERRVQGRPIFAALFPALPAGEYVVWCDAATANTATIAGAAVAELDWREMDVTLPPKWDAYSYQPGNWRQRPRPAVTPEMLPPRYRSGQPVTAAPMGSAPMRYGEDGEVAWDQMWTNFCDLALAGGPPHRDTMLEPAPPQAVLAAPDDYRRVVDEIERGLRLVTGLRTVCSGYPGWVGLQCGDEAMARWLVCAIEVENVAVYHEGAVLYLPAGPSFRRDREIKNVITVVAKTHHYYAEHLVGTAASPVAAGSSY